MSRESTVSPDKSRSKDRAPGSRDDDLAAAKWRSRSVLITGAAGFLGGSAATTLVASGAFVHGLDLDWSRDEAGARAFTVVEGDVRDQSLVESIIRAERVDTLLHFAAQTLVGPALEAPTETFSKNIEGTWTVLDACRRTSTVSRILVASSDKAYGDAGGRAYSESMPLAAAHPYDASKAAADIIARTYAETYGLPVAVSRCGNLYGPGDRNWSRIVPGTIRSILLGEPPVIRSDGSPTRDYLHVRDAVSGLLRLTQAVGEDSRFVGSAFNFSGGERRSVLQVVTEILDLMHSSLKPLVLGTARFEIANQRLSTVKARHDLSWTPSTSLSRGLAETIAWLDRNRHLID